MIVGSCLGCWRRFETCPYGGPLCPSDISPAEAGETEPHFCPVTLTLTLFHQGRGICLAPLWASPTRIAGRFETCPYVVRPLTLCEGGMVAGGTKKGTLPLRVEWERRPGDTICRGGMHLILYEIERICQSVRQPLNPISSDALTSNRHGF